ncbi:hypothetical protein, partial [Trebonia sp.]|uniref:hypothetical protein n=1 Tax=Trebonia sp. TaxID=2767075 RepID=UPI00261A5951
MIAATLAAGAAAYGATLPRPPEPGKLMAALSVPIEQETFAAAGAGKPEAEAATRTGSRRPARSHAARPRATASAS